MPIFKVLSDNNLDKVEMLYKINGQEILNSRTVFNLTPLHIAIKKGLKEISEFLVENGADVNLYDDSKSTPLFDACLNNDRDMIIFLYKHGANLNHKDIYGMTPLHHSLSSNKLNSVKTLLGLGCNSLDDFHQYIPKEAKTGEIFEFYENIFLSINSYEYVIKESKQLTNDDIISIERSPDIIISRLRNNFVKSYEYKNEIKKFVNKITSNPITSFRTKAKFNELILAIDSIDKIKSGIDINLSEIEILYNYRDLFENEILKFSFKNVYNLKTFLINNLHIIASEAKILSYFSDILSSIEKSESYVYAMESVLIRFVENKKDIALLPFDILNSIVNNYKSISSQKYGSNQEYDIFFQDWSKIQETYLIYKNNNNYQIAGYIFFKFFEKYNNFLEMPSITENLKLGLFKAINEFLSRKSIFHRDIHSFLEKKYQSLYDNFFPIKNYR